MSRSSSTTAVGELGTQIAESVTEGAQEAAAATDAQTRSYILLKTAAIDAMSTHDEYKGRLNELGIAAGEFGQEVEKAGVSLLAFATAGEEIAAGALSDLTSAIGDWSIAQNLVNDAVSGASANAQIWQRDLSDIEKAQGFYNKILEEGGTLTQEQTDNLNVLNSAHGRVSDGLKHYQEIEAEAIVQREKFRAVQDELNKKLEDGVISQEDYDQAMRDTTLAMGGEKDVMAELGRIIGVDLVGAIDDLISGLQELISQEWEPKVTVETDPALVGVEGVDRALYELSQSDIEVVPHVETGEALENIGGVQTRLEDLDSMGVTAEVYADVSAAEAEIARIMGIVRSGVTLPVSIGVPSGSSGDAFAEGGISQGGIALVGERGPELVLLPRGAEVLTNHETRRYLGGYADGTGAGLNVRNSGPFGAIGSPSDIVARTSPGHGSGAYEAGLNIGTDLGQGIVDAAIAIIDKETYQMALSVGDKSVSAIIEALQTGAADIGKALDVVLSGAIGDAGDILNGLLDAWHDITEEIARQGLLGNDTAALEEQLAVIEAVIREWAERVGLDAGKLFEEGFIEGFSFPELIQNFGDGITSWAAETEEMFREWGRESGEAFAEGFLEEAENRFNPPPRIPFGSAPPIVQPGIDDPVFGTPPIGTGDFGTPTDEVVGMVTEMFAELEALFSATPELVDDMLDEILQAVQDGALTWEQAMQLMAHAVDEEMITALERLEEQWTAKLAQAIIDGDAAAIESIQELLAWINQIQAGVDGATEAVEQYGAQLGETFGGGLGPTSPIGGDEGFVTDSSGKQIPLITDMPWHTDVSGAQELQGRAGRSGTGREQPQTINLYLADGDREALATWNTQQTSQRIAGSVRIPAGGR